MHSDSPQGKDIILPPSDSPLPSVFAFSIHKGGSSLLFSILQELAPSIGLTYFSLPDVLFNTGYDIHRQNPEWSRFFHSKGYLYGGFRVPCPLIPGFLLNNARKILLLRNPLDSIVSHYFSMAHSHVKPGRSQSLEAAERFAKSRSLVRSQDINTFVQHRSEKLLKTLEAYLDIARDPLTAVFTYEDVIYRKADFVQSICDHFGWEIPRNIIVSITSRYDVFPDREDVNSHIRQVHPGNYRRHLDKQTIKTLATRFKPVMRSLTGHRKKLRPLPLRRRMAVWKLRSRR